MKKTNQSRFTLQKYFTIFFIYNPQQVTVNCNFWMINQAIESKSLMMIPSEKVFFPLKIKMHVICP